MMQSFSAEICCNSIFCAGAMLRATEVNQQSSRIPVTGNPRPVREWLCAPSMDSILPHQAENTGKIQLHTLTTSISFHFVSTAGLTLQLQARPDGRNIRAQMPRQGLPTLCAELPATTGGPVAPVIGAIRPLMEIFTKRHNWLDGHEFWACTSKRQCFNILTD